MTCSFSAGFSFFNFQSAAMSLVTKYSPYSRGMYPVHPVIMSTLNASASLGRTAVRVSYACCCKV